MNSENKRTENLQDCRQNEENRRYQDSSRENRNQDEHPGPKHDSSRENRTADNWRENNRNLERQGSLGRRSHGRNMQVRYEQRNESQPRFKSFNNRAPRHNNHWGLNASYSSPWVNNSRPREGSEGGGASRLSASRSRRSASRSRRSASRRSVNQAKKEEEEPLFVIDWAYWEDWPAPSLIRRSGRKGGVKGKGGGSRDGSPARFIKSVSARDLVELQDAEYYPICGKDKIPDIIPNTAAFQYWIRLTKKSRKLLCADAEEQNALVYRKIGSQPTEVPMTIEAIEPQLFTNDHPKTEKDDEFSIEDFQLDSPRKPIDMKFFEDSDHSDDEAPTVKLEPMPADFSDNDSEGPFACKLPEIKQRKANLWTVSNLNCILPVTETRTERRERKKGRDRNRGEEKRNRQATKVHHEDCEKLDAVRKLASAELTTDLCERFSFQRRRDKRCIAALEYLRRTGVDLPKFQSAKEKPEADSRRVQVVASMTDRQRNIQLQLALLPKAMKLKLVEQLRRSDPCDEDPAETALREKKASERRAKEEEAKALCEERESSAAGSEKVGDKTKDILEKQEKMKDASQVDLTAPATMRERSLTPHLRKNVRRSRNRTHRRSRRRRSRTRSRSSRYRRRRRSYRRLRTPSRRRRSRRRRSLSRMFR